MSRSSTITTADQEQEQEHDLDHDPEVASPDNAVDHPTSGDRNTQGHAVSSTTSVFLLLC